MSELQSQFFELRPGRRLHIIMNIPDSQKKTLFFLHGLGGRADQWQASLEYFCHEYNIIAPDLLGHGQSPKPKSNPQNCYSFKEMAEDVSTIFERFASDSNVLIGHSYGGAQAAYLAVRYSGEIQQLIAVTPLTLRSDYKVPAITHLPVAVLELMRSQMEDSFRELAFSKATSPELIESEIIKGRENPMYVIKSVTNSFKQIPEIEPERLHVPTLVITEKEDKLTPESYVKGYYTKLSRVTFESIPQAGHMVIIEQPEKLNALIQRFISA